MERSELVAIYVPPGDMLNRMWSRERRAYPAWRWTVRVRLHNSNGYGMHPVLSYKMFRTYTAAMKAIKEVT